MRNSEMGAPQPLPEDIPNPEENPAGQFTQKKIEHDIAKVGEELDQRIRDMYLDDTARIRRPVPRRDMHAVRRLQQEELGYLVEETGDVLDALGRGESTGASTGIALQMPIRRDGTTGSMRVVEDPFNDAPIDQGEADRVVETLDEALDLTG